MPIYLDGDSEPATSAPRPRPWTPWRLWAATPSPAPLASRPQASAADAVVARITARCCTCDYSRVGAAGDRECHRSPPTNLPGERADVYAAAWPSVADLDWCGEFRPQ